MSSRLTLAVSYLIKFTNSKYNSKKFIFTICVSSIHAILIYFLINIVFKSTTPLLAVILHGKISSYLKYPQLIIRPQNRPEIWHRKKQIVTRYQNVGSSCPYFNHIIIKIFPFF